MKELVITGLIKWIYKELGLSWMDFVIDKDRSLNCLSWCVVRRDVYDRLVMSSISLASNSSCISSLSPISFPVHSSIFSSLLSFSSHQVLTSPSHIFALRDNETEINRQIRKAIFNAISMSISMQYQSITSYDHILLIPPSKSVIPRIYF